MKLLLGGLGILCLLLLATSAPALAAQSPGDVTIQATVLGQAPSQSPIIETPVSGTTFQQKQTEIKGTCIASLVVKVFRNDIFAGSALCQPDNTFSLQIDLIENKNDLVVRQYDLLSQPSPPSDAVQVFYSATQPALSTDEGLQTAKFQLVIDYDYNFQGIFANEPFNLPVHFTGGSTPYAINIDWGDSQNNVFSRKDASQFFAEHTYTKAGPQSVKIRVSDSDGQEASLQFVLIVNGGPVAAVPLNGEGSSTSQTVWEAVLYSSLATGAASFTAGFLLATFWDTMRIKIKGAPKNKN